MPQRIRVTSPQTRLALLRRTDARRSLGRLSGRGTVPSTAIDLAAAERAMRRQRRQAVRTVVALGITLTVLMIGANLAPGRWGWAVLFFAPYPFLLALAFVHVRRAERIEADS
ncbi:hypothetical protein [Glycomyces buryatensis]|uniref:Uncharacterized protein n=1 Tax=Glycomyces buryatensis TaxID=2570927 RepID=A0A4S8Q3Q8_9ACTN|nr:hypothetical protein [Glycomyces buryatensis]THV38660.1 hypothetical protein FAB82_19720 [Glycomyces buryatensis]